APTGGRGHEGDAGAPREPLDLLDLGVAPRLDAGIEAALLLAALADRAGDNVHLVAADREVRARVSGVRGAGLMRQIADSLTDVVPDLRPVDWDLVAAEVRRTVHHRALVVLVTEVPPVGTDPDFLQAVSQLASTHLVVVASAADPEVVRLARAGGDAASVYAAAAAGATIHESRVGARDAERAGALVIDTDAGLLAARLSDTYLSLKKQGRL
ncbi:MAG: DUF58 domain-containing protein, partial [Propionibacterium sp.]|nr:DUF58 domain-containing protein [Propionibacterium sp.]